MSVPKFTVTEWPTWLQYQRCLELGQSSSSSVSKFQTVRQIPSLRSFANTLHIADESVLQSTATHMENAEKPLLSSTQEYVAKRVPAQCCARRHAHRFAKYVGRLQALTLDCQRAI